MTASFVLVDSPHWDRLSPDIHEVKRLLEEGMRAWSSIPGADIQWEIGEIAPDVPDDFRDRNFIVVDPLAPSTGANSSAGLRADGRFYTDRMGIRFALESLSSRGRFRAVLLHELGHLLGLGHAAVYSTLPGRPVDRLPEVWRSDPIMSYGNRGDPRRDYHEMLTPDDRAGAVLARPLPGWLARTGNIRGEVLVEGAGGADLVNVLATRVRADGTLGRSVGVITNGRGEFVIGGLEPGSYVLLVRSLTVQGAHTKFLPRVTTDVRDTLWTKPIAVRAGRRAGPVTITVAPGGEAGSLP